MLTKNGYDVWFGEYVAVETSSEVRFCAINKESRKTKDKYDICTLRQNSKLNFLPKLSAKNLAHGLMSKSLLM